MTSWPGPAFSPLFIGEVSSTPFCIHYDHGGHRFQSPLHRGSLFNPQVLTATDSAVASFQSPLHRGSLFNDNSTADNKRDFFTFSPLFIGEVSSTHTERIAAQPELVLSVPSSSGKSLQQEECIAAFTASEIFQSPLHRGSLFNALPSSQGRMDSKTFSPLFIGEVSSTPLAP